MAGVRISAIELDAIARRRKDWNKRGVKAGHGGQFDTSFANPFSSKSSATAKGRKVKRASKATSTPYSDNYYSSIGTAGINIDGLPDWLVDIIRGDNEIKRGLVEKGYKPDSPHKMALIALAKDISLLDGRPATETKKAKRGNPEHYIQVRIFYEIERQFPEFYPLCKAVPNGGLRDKRTAWALLAEGQKAGAPDIDIEIPLGKYHGMKLEVKTESGTVQANQKEKIEALNKLGYLSVVGKGFDACWDLITRYFALPLFDNITSICYRE